MGFGDKITEAIGEGMVDNLDGLAEKITEVEHTFGSFGIDLDGITGGALSEYKEKVLECANATDAAAEKMRLIAGMKVDEVLGDEYGAAEKSIATERLTKEQNKIYEDIMDKQADKMSKASNAGNDYYQDLAARLEEATGGQYRATTGNTVRHNDENRTLVFEDENGEKTEEKSIEWVAETIAAYEAMEKVGVNAEKAKVSLDNLEDSLIDSFGEETGKEITSGFKNFITSGNLESLSQEDYEKLSGMNKEELMEAMGFDSWNLADHIEFEKMFGEHGFEGFQDAIDDYGTALDTFTENLLPNVQEAFDAIDDTEGLSVTGQKAIAQALQDAMVYGGQDAVDGLTNTFKQMTKDDLATFGDVTSKITDWGNTSVTDLQDALEEAGMETELTTAQLDEYIKVMRDANNVTMDFSKIATEYAEAMKIASGLETGKTISAEDYQKLGDVAEGYFTKMLDGTYKLTKDASDFYDVVKEDKVKDFKDSLGEQRNKIVGLQDLRNRDYDLTKLSEVQGENHKFRDTMYDLGQNVSDFYGFDVKEREQLSLEDRKNKNLT